MRLRDLMLIAIMLILGTSGICQITEEEAAQAKREAEYYESLSKKYKSMMGDIDTSGLPKGEVKADSTQIEAKILGYRGVAGAVDSIVGFVLEQRPSPRKIVLISTAEAQALFQYQEFSRQTLLILNRAASARNMAQPDVSCANLQSGSSRMMLESSRNKAFLLGTVAPGNVVNTGLEILSLFKTDTTFKGYDVSVDDFALQTIAMRKLRSHGVQVVYPPVYFPNILESDAENAQIYDLYTNLVNEADALAVATGSAANYAAQLTRAVEAASTGACRDSLVLQAQRMTRRHDELKSLKKIVESIVAALMTPDEKTGVTPISRFVRAERLADKFNSGHLLELKAIAAGGTSRVKTNLFGSSLSFGGGAIISFMLTDSRGEYVTSGTIPYYGGYIKAKDLTRRDMSRRPEGFRNP